MTVSGQVFIVTKSRDTIKFALVEVSAIPELELSTHMKKKTESARVPVEQLGQKLKVIERESKANTHEFKRLYDIYNRNPSAENHRLFRAYAKVVNKATDYLLETVNEYFRYTSPAFYFQDLPTAVATGKTDADGKFTLAVPPGKYFFAAKEIRTLASGTVIDYYWLVSVDATKPVQGLMLSSDNEMGTKCGTCAPMLREETPPSTTAGVAKTGITKE